MSSSMMIFALVLVGLFGGANAHADGCRCGQANVVCRKHQWMIMAMFAVLLTYIWMYGEMLFMRYFGSCYRWFQEKFGSAKPAVEFHACGHSCGCGCDHHHEHKHADCDDSDCDACNDPDIDENGLMKKTNFRSLSQFMKKGCTHDDSENKKEQ